MDDHYDKCIQQAHRNHALFTIIGAVIFKEHQWAGEYALDIFEVEAVFGEV